MTTALALLAALTVGGCVGFTLALLWLADHDTQAPDVHDPATCPVCASADDEVLERFDLTLWSIEMGGAL